MIEEIDSATYTKHYFQKVYGELGSNPQAFLEAALDFLAQNTAFFSQPGAADTLAELAQRHTSSSAGTSSTAAPSPAVVTTPPAPPPAAAAPSPPPSAPAVAPAQPPLPAAEPPAAQPQPGTKPPAVEEGGETEGTGLKPNVGNGADLESYSWIQTLSEVTVTVPVPAGTKGRACDVSISRDKLRVGLKGQPPILDGPLFAPIKPDDCLWNLVDGRQLELTLQKKDGMQWWRCVVQGQPEINVQKVEPESSKLTDLDPEMRATVEKMMYDQRQKSMGLPTSDQQSRANILEQFKAQHPEMDFSNAKIEM